MDAAKGEASKGPSPMSVLLSAIATCTAMDVVSILEKKRQVVTNFEVRVNGERATEHPKVFTNIVIEFVVTGHQVDRAAVERSVEVFDLKDLSELPTMREITEMEE